MGVELTWRYGGVDLDQPGRGWRLLADGTSTKLGRSVVQNLLTVPGRHGAIDTGEQPTYEPGQVTLSWNLNASSQAALEAAYDDLYGILARPGRDLERVAAGVSKQAPARLVSITEPSQMVAGRLFVKCTATLSLFDPFLRDTTASETGILAVGGGRPVPWCVGTGPVADAIVRLGPDVPSSGAGVVDAANGTGVSYTLGTTSGQYVYIDPSTMRAWRTTSSSAWTGGGTEAGAYLDYPAAGPLQLQPTTTQGMQVVETNFAPNPAGGSDGGWATGGSSSFSVAWDTSVRRRAASRSRKVTSLSALSTFGDVTVVGGANNTSFDVPSTEAGKAWTIGMHVRHAESFAVRARMLWSFAVNGQMGVFEEGPWVNLDSGQWEALTRKVTPPAGVTGSRMRVQFARTSGTAPSGTSAWVADAWAGPPAYFDGGTTGAGGRTYGWVGAAHSSASTASVTGYVRRANVNVSGAPAVIYGKGAWL